MEIDPNELLDNRNRQLWEIINESHSIKLEPSRNEKNRSVALFNTGGFQ